MIRAYSSMSFDDFVTELRTFAIAWNLGPAVVDHIDALYEPMTQDAIDAAINEAEEKSYDRGQEDMRESMLSDMNSYLDNNENVTAEDLLKYISR